MDDQPTLTLADFAPACHLPDPEELDLLSMAMLDGVPAGLFLLITSNPKRSDILAEHEAIESLMILGWTPGDISAASGLNRPALDRRLRLAHLHPDMLDFHKEHPLTNSVIESCAKLPHEIQVKLAAQARANGKLTALDVATERRARRDEAVATLPDELFAAEVESPTLAHTWQAEVVSDLQRALGRIPDSASHMRAELEEIVNEWIASKLETA